MKHLLLALITLPLAWSTARAADWPQHQHDARRSGFTREEVKPPYRVAWKHSFLPERPARRTQAIAYDKRVFVGTQQGVMHCFDAETGKELWTFKGAGSIQHSAACDGGMVFFGSLDGSVYAVDCRTGARRWKRQTDAPFSAAPLVARDHVYIGNHRGAFLAIRQKTGDFAWVQHIRAPVFGTAACDDGRVFVGGEDMRLHAFDAATGRRLWRSEQLWGMSFKDYHPVVHKGHVLVRPMASFEADIYTDRYSKYGAWPDNMPGGWRAVWGPGKWGKGFKGLYAEAEDVRAGKMPKELMDRQLPVIEHFEKTPEDQDLFILDVKSGKQALIPPHFRVMAMHGAVTPPAEDFRGTLVVPWCHMTHGWGRYDIARNRMVELIVPPRACNADENVNVSCGGRYVYVMHCEEGNANYTGVYDLATKTWTPIHGDVPWYDNLQSGANPASIGYGRFYHILFYTLVARTTQQEARR